MADAVGHSVEPPEDLDRAAKARLHLSRARRIQREGLCTDGSRHLCQPLGIAARQERTCATRCQATTERLAHTATGTDDNEGLRHDGSPSVRPAVGPQVTRAPATLAQTQAGARAIPPFD